MRRAVQRLSTLSLTTGTAMLMVSCALPARQHGDVSMHRFQPPFDRRITQLGFGRHAHFVLCAIAACPAVTRQTASVLGSGSAQKPTQTPLARAGAKPAEIRHATLIVHFASGSSTLSAEAKTALGRVLAAIRVAGHVLISGRTDNTGHRAANDAIALARSHAVLTYLKAKLPPPSPVFTIDARGACCFIASNDTPEGRRQNRRVEVVLALPSQAPGRRDQDLSRRTTPSTRRVIFPWRLP